MESIRDRRRRKALGQARFTLNGTGFGAEIGHFWGFRSISP